MRRVTRVIIGLDVGTTAVKAAAFPVRDDAGPRPDTDRATTTAQMDLRLLQPRPGWQVQDPKTLLGAVDRALFQCLSGLPDRIGTQVVGISLSTAMHALVGLDAYARPITEVITWADSRARAEAADLRLNHDPIRLLHRSGTPVHPMSPMVKLRWMTAHQPDLCGQVRQWVGLKELVLHHLTESIATELSSASATGLLDLATRSWDPEAAELAGISLDQLADVLPTTTTFPLAATVARFTSLPAGLPVVIGAADGPLGNLGTGAIVPGVVGLSIGTSGAARMALPQPTFDPAGRLFSYALTEDVWVSGGAISNGGVAVHWAGSTFAPHLAGRKSSDDAFLELAASAAAGSSGLVMMPYVLAERAPLDPDLPAMIAGLRFGHEPRHFVRAALEGVCRQLAGIVTTLASVAPVTGVRATGTPFGSELWRRVMAAHLDHPLVVASDAGGTALGAAALGAYALGLADSLPTALTAVGGQLGFDPEDAEQVDPAEAAVYQAASASLPGMLDAYRGIATGWTTG